MKAIFHSHLLSLRRVWHLLIGKTLYSRASGRVKVDGHDAEPLGFNSLYWMASMTKLVTAVSIMQLVESGILSLDDDIRDKVPELANIQIIEDMNEGTSSSHVLMLWVAWLLKNYSSHAQINAAPASACPRKDNSSVSYASWDLSRQTENNNGVLRDLACHTSGFVYDSLSSLLQKWSKSVGRTAHTFSGSMVSFITLYLSQGLIYLEFENFYRNLLIGWIHSPTPLWTRNLVGIWSRFGLGWSPSKSHNIMASIWLATHSLRLRMSANVHSKSICRKISGPSSEPHQQHFIQN